VTENKILISSDSWICR